MLKELYIKPVLNSIKNRQANAPVERVNKSILNMLVTKDIDNKVFDYIYPWGENLSSIACAIRAPYRCNIMATPGQAVFAKDLVFNLVVVVEW